MRKQENEELSEREDLSNPLLSVVITTKNEVNNIENCLWAVLNQTYRNFEIILVDDKSCDGTIEKVSKIKDESKSYPNCKNFVFLSRNADSAAKGRNIGVKEAKGSIIAFTDADCVPKSNWLQKLMKYISDDKIVGGPNILKHRNQTKILFAVDHVLGTYLGSGGSAQFLKIDSVSEVYSIPACNMAISKRLFEKVGGFNEYLKFNEDSEFCHRLKKKGYKIIYNPEAKVEHFIGIDSLSDFSNFFYKYGLERGKNVSKNPKLITGFNIIAIGVIIILASSLFLSLFLVYAFIIFLSIVFVISIILFLASIKIAIKNKSLILPFTGFLIFIIEYFAYNFGFFKGYFQRKSTW